MHGIMLTKSTSLECISEAEGILPVQHLERLLGRQINSASAIERDQLQPSSLDLRLGAQAHRVEASFLPGEDCTVASRLSTLGRECKDLRQGAILRKGEIYIVPLQETLELATNVSGFANPKSSTGRLDIFTRLITDYGTEFDRVPSNYRGPIYAEISPRSFDIIVAEGTRLLQLRLQAGERSPSDAALMELNARFSLIPDDLTPDIKNAGIAIRVDISGKDNNGIVGFRAKRAVPGPIDVAKVRTYDARDYWEPLQPGLDGGLVLEPDEFYILASKQAICIPPDVAGEMVAYDTLVGEFRVHYAGFFDPGFGIHGDGTLGTRAVLEVRSHEVPFLIEDGQIMGRIVYHDLLEKPATMYGQGIGSNYAKQGLTLAKQFRPWSFG